MLNDTFSVIFKHRVVVTSQVVKILFRTAHFMAQHTMLDALLLSWPFMLIFDTYWCTLKVHFPQFL